MLRQVILAASRSGALRRVVEHAPVTKQVVNRFVPGASLDDAVHATTELVTSGRAVTIDYLGEDTLDATQAQATADAYVALLGRLADAGLTRQGRAEVSVKLSAVGQAFDEAMALDHATRICQAAADAGTTVTLDMEDHTTTDSTLDILGKLRQDFPGTGAVLQSYLHRTEADCRDLATEGSRVRLCKGAYKEPASVAFQGAKDVDRSYVRCMKVLMAGPGYPMLATHDPRLVAIGLDLAKERAKGTYEFQMLYGIRPTEQERLAAEGETVRVYLPYGDEWYGYFMRRLAERPANVTFFLRSLASKS
ncbi:MAG TPA: proline dehydrogenase family protein [Mycobacteriales bacterium]|jgi:proline dehydrogenase|nr:proline dehydrogenase family protein [Mycobacteriales bacterium]